MKILDSLSWRYATKKFDVNKKLSEKQVNGILEIFNLTPTSYGLQPLRFIRVKNELLREALLDASWNQKQVVEASELFIICIEKQLDEAHVDAYIKLVCETRNLDADSSRFDSFKKMLMNVVEWPKDEYQDWAKKQAYIALGNLMTACATEKIDACPMEGFDPLKYDEILGLKERGLKSVLACPVGFRSEEDETASLKKVRKNISDITLEL